MRYCSYFAALWCIASSAALVGCSGDTETTTVTAEGDSSAVVGTPEVSSSESLPKLPVQVAQVAPAKTPPKDYREAERTFEDLLNKPDAGEPDPDAFGGANFGHPQHDDAKLAAGGIRKIEGKQLTVYTDLPRGDVDDFPKVFDLALPQWQSYFNLPADAITKWRMTLYVVKDKDLFRRAGLIDEGLPPFQNGYQRGFEMWVYDQPSDYYRRHLFLHEATHAAMNCLLGGAGPPWYMEGVAELLATHGWDGTKLTLRHNPRTRDEVPFWGRVKIVRDDFAANTGMTLESILQYDNRAHQNVNAYAWCWAACQFLDNHPQTQKAFRAMQPQVRLPAEDFNRRFVEQISDWDAIAHEQWFLYTQSLDYGSDVAASIVKDEPGRLLASGELRAEIDARGGWQPAGIWVKAGQTYAISAQGKFTIARDADGTPWPCEPNGVTLRYHAGRPLGELLVAVRNTPTGAGEVPSLAVATPIGRSKKFTPKIEGGLYFKINDSPAELGDNEGVVKIRVAVSK